MRKLEDAPAHFKLAVDLIMLLEQNQIPPQQALDALALVTQDCQSKLVATVTSPESSSQTAAHGPLPQ